MIRIAREREPKELPPIRAARLAAARAVHAAGQRVQFADYDVVKPQLADMQHIKCCYCEKREEQAKYRDVEHYRPKSPYWWLAWTWENLLFSCIDCNREHKRGRFPLSPGDTALLAEQTPPGGERPQILDPSDPGFDPTLHIEFRREVLKRIERWRPYGLTDEGRTTIDVCGLDRPGLLDLYRDHVNDIVRPKLAPVFEAQEAPSVVRSWTRACRALLAPERPFRALSHDAMKALVPQALRDRYHLELPRP